MQHSFFGLLGKRDSLTICSKLHALIGLVMIGMLGTAQAAPIFSDDFDTGASALWGNDSGTWSASGGVYTTPTTNNFPNIHSFVNLALNNFSINVDVNNAYDGGIWLRGANDAGPIGATGVLFVFARGDMYWHDVSAGSYGSILNQASSAFTLGSNFSLRFDVQGNTYSAFLNGALTPITQLINNSFSSGFAGVYSNDSRQSFDNVEISAVPLPASLPLFAGALGLFGLVGWRRKRNAAA